MMQAGIYSITNVKNNKRYIGSSKNIEERWRVHRHRLNKNKHHSDHLQKSYNIDSLSFKYEVLELVEDLSQLTAREQYWVNYYQSYKSDYGYNACRTVSPLDPERARERWAKPGERERQSARMKQVCNSKSWKENTREARERLKSDKDRLAEYAKVRLLTSPHRKKVQRIETDEIFESIAEASKKLGVSVVKIRDSANGKRKSNSGMSFRWVSDGK